MTISRADRSLLSEWLFTVDRALIAAFAVLAATGVVLAFGASPAVAVRKGLDPFHFATRQAVFAVAGVVVALAVSLLSPRALRRFALALLLGALVAMVAVLLVGPEVNGARRWLRFAGLSIQPSEFAKPAFVVISAWLLGEAGRRPDVPAVPMAGGLLAVFAGLLAAEPDIGQAVLVGAVWGALFVLAGQPLRHAAAIAGAGVGGLVAAYFTFGHVRSRIDRFLDPGAGDTYQMTRATQSFREGGFLGRGPGEGTIKSVLPDAHTDFIFAVIAEEYGALACLALVAVFAFIVFRVLVRVRHRDLFARLAASGLALLLVLQALINMGVNVGLLPAKGMTLPFISAGGSSTLAMSLSAGLLLALTRQGAAVRRLKKPTFAHSHEPIGSTRQ